MSRDAGDVMQAARALDERMRIEAEVQLRFEKEIDSVEVRKGRDGRRPNHCVAARLTLCVAA